MVNSADCRNIPELFRYLEETDSYVFLDTSKPDEANGRSLLFTEPLERLQYRTGEDRKKFMERLQRWLEQGYYLAGWFGYEFLHDFLLKNQPRKGIPAADLGVFREPLCFEDCGGRSAMDVPGPDDDWDQDERYRLANLLPSMTKAEYCKAIEKILDYIAAGDTYQVNYTFKFSFNFHGPVLSFYRKLRRSQPVPYGCCIRNGDSYILSFSPELFFRMKGGKILARPMKGTMKRGRNNREDIEHASFLQSDEKNRSENVMIVDLLRNDLSRLVEATGGGTVEVESLFDVERYRTVFQMTSSVVADRREQSVVAPQDILEAIFPCGSVTGAPKIRTMEIIDELEKEQRGVYTGAIGYFSPGGKAAFNVPIRTVVLNGDKGEMGIGSGIVADSSPESEWDECLLKAGFLTDPVPEFSLIETLFYHGDDGCLFLDSHLNRLEDSAKYYGFYCDRVRVEKKLVDYCRTLGTEQGYRVRLLLARDGRVNISSGECGRPALLELPPPSANRLPVEVLIDFAEEDIDSSQPRFLHKTTMRDLYDSALAKGRESGLFDVVFCNRNGEVTEGCISNLFILKDGCYYTPALSSGLLDGVMRRHLLDSGCNSPVFEKILSKEEVLDADRVFVCNSVRGLVPAQFPVKG